MMRRVIFVLGFLCAALSTKASDVYITQSGSGSGASCADPKSVAYFNNTLTAGTTVHLCGTFTGSAGQQLFAVRGSGTSSSPITIKFETGAVLTAPYWSALGAIYVNGNSYVTIDGGTNGIIENTANGTTLANHVPSRGIYAPSCTGCVVENLTIANLYVHSSASDVYLASASDVNCIYFNNAANALAKNLTCHDAGWAITGPGNNSTIENSNFYNIDHGIADGAAGTLTGLSIHDNHFHDFANWDTSSDTYHHDGIHLWGHVTNGTPNNVTNCVLYNNTLDGDPGTNHTAFIYLEDSIQNVTVFNNSFIEPSTSNMTALWLAGRTTSNPLASGNAVYNNYVQGGGVRTSGAGILSDNQNNYTQLNNIVIGGESDLGLNGGTLSSSGIDYNLYDDLYTDTNHSDTDVWGSNGKTYFALATWQGACNCDHHSLAVTLANMKLSSTGVPQTGSPAIGLGINLTNIATGTLAPLARDKNGVARPATGAWTVGAYESQGSTSIDYGNGFTSTGLALNGTAALNGTRLRLTNGFQSQTASAWYTTPVNVQTFTTDFTFQLTNATADGFTFAIQNAGTTAIGSCGAGLAYGSSTCSSQPGIGSSVAVKFDLFQNSHEGNNSTGLYTDGATPTDPSTTLGNGVSLHSGNIMKVHITYDGTTLTMTITDTVTNATFTTSWPINIPSTVGSGTAYAGFTGATGGQTSTQEIITWTFNN
jgi:Legume lectin domain